LLGRLAETTAESGGKAREVEAGQDRKWKSFPVITGRQHDERRAVLHHVIELAHRVARQMYAAEAFPERGSELRVNAGRQHTCPTFPPMNAAKDSACSPARSPQAADVNSTRRYRRQVKVVTKDAAWAEKTGQV